MIRPMRVMSAIKHPAVIVGLIMLVLGGVAFARGQSVERESLAGEFSLPLQSYDGKTVYLSAFRHPVLVVFAWASWCPYCGDEMRDLAALQARSGGSVRIVGVNRGEPLVDAKRFSDMLGVGDELALLLDPEDTFYKSIGGYAMPEFIFLDYRGEVVFRSRGPMTSAEVEAQIAAMQ